MLAQLKTRNAASNWSSFSSKKASKQRKRTAWSSFLSTTLSERATALPLISWLKKDRTLTISTRTGRRLFFTASERVISWQRSSWCNTERMPRSLTIMVKLPFTTRFVTVGLRWLSTWSSAASTSASRTSAASPLRSGQKNGLKTKF